MFSGLVSALTARVHTSSAASIVAAACRLRSVPVLAFLRGVDPLLFFACRLPAAGGRLAPAPIDGAPTYYYCLCLTYGRWKHASARGRLERGVHARISVTRVPGRREAGDDALLRKTRRARVTQSGRTSPCA